MTIFGVTMLGIYGAGYLAARIYEDESRLWNKVAAVCDFTGKVWNAIWENVRD